MEKNIRILIVDDHAIVREGLRGLIEVEPDMELAGEASSGVEGVEKALTLRPDVILMDLLMPEMDGVTAIKEIKMNWQEARVLVLTSFLEDDKVFPAIESGALGYLLKDTQPDELLDAIRGVHSGETMLHPSIAKKIMQRIQESGEDSKKPEGPELTERELDVLKLLAQGDGDRDIAEKLVVSERTVHFHVGNILSKLHLANRTQAALYAIRKGLAKPDID
ncbi:MAG: response regulator transcription factor [Anaerolineales bacterium]|jgi:NarL family two-component system response regulator LiaR